MDFGFGFVPDVLRGKNPLQAFKTNAKQGLMAGMTFFAPGSTEAVGATTGAFDFSPSFGGLVDGAKDAMGYVKPIGEAAGAAQSVGGLLSGPQVQAPQPQGINPQGAQTLAQLAQQGQVNPDELMKMRRQTMWG